jgi:cell shape-determining protein MreC
METNQEKKTFTFDDLVTRETPKENKTNNLSEIQILQKRLEALEQNATRVVDRLNILLSHAHATMINTHAIGVIFEVLSEQFKIDIEDFYRKVEMRVEETLRLSEEELKNNESIN